MSKVWKMSWLLLLLAGFVSIFSLCQYKTADASAGINQQISFEGKVVNSNGTNITDGTYNVEFKIYQDGTNTGSGSTLDWTEDHLVSASNGVAFTSGTFQVNLGSITSLSSVNFNDPTLWLSIQVGNTASCTVSGNFKTNCGGDGEMSPYIALDATPYAFNANLLNGIASSGYLQLSPSSAQSGSISITGGTVTVGGTTVLNTSGIVQNAALSSSTLYSNLTQVGTITAGTWNASTLNPAYGGTGQSSYTVGDLLYASASTTLSKLSDIATGSCLISGGSATAPTWGSCVGTGVANTALSNLASVAINTSLLPGTTNSINIGSSSLTFANGYYGTGVTTPLLQSASGTALTITANAASTWSSTAGLSVQAGGTNTLALDTTGAGSVNVGSANATTVNVGFTSAASAAQTVNIAQGAGNDTVNIATGAGTDTINVGGSGDNVNVGGSGATSIIQGGNTKETFGSSGDTIQTTTNSMTAFQVQDASGQAILVVDTSTTSNILTNPGFETGINGWSADGGSSTISQNTTKANVYHGQASLKTVISSATANQGAKTTAFNTALASNTTYTLSFYAEATAANAITAGHADNGSTETACTLNATTLSTAGFTQFSCTFTTGTISGTPYIFIEQSTAATNTLYIDAVQLTIGSTLTPYGAEGAIQLRGIVNSPLAFQSSSNSTTALQVANASGTNLFSIDTLDGLVQIGSNVADGTQINLQLDSSNNYTDSGTCTTTSNQGALYYNSNTGTVRGCINGNWEDLVSTGGLGLLLYGVVADSSNSGNVGELSGITQTTSPCKVYWASATSVAVAPCYAYSGGRKITVAATTISTSAIAASAFVNVCLTGTNGQPALVGTGNTTETSAGLPAWNPNNPIVCLATLQMSTTAGTITGGKIYDVRTFTVTSKTFATLNTAMALGTAAVQTTTANILGAPSSTAGSGYMRGVIVAYSGATSTTTANVILATAGPQWVKATGTSTAGQYAENATTANGYTTSSTATVPTNPYALLGVTTRTIDTTCTSNTTCQYSQFLNPLNIGY